MNAAAKKPNKANNNSKGPNKGSNKGPNNGPNKSSKDHKGNDRNQKGGKGLHTGSQNQGKHKDMKSVKKIGNEKKHESSKTRQKCVKILNLIIDLLYAILDLLIIGPLCAIKDLFVCQRKKSAAKPEMKGKEKPIVPSDSLSLVPRNQMPIVHDDEYYLDLYKKQMYKKQITSPEEAIALRPIRVNPIRSAPAPIPAPIPDIESEEEEVEEEEVEEEESDIEVTEEEEEEDAEDEEEAEEDEEEEQEDDE